MNKILFAVSLMGLLFSSIFTIVSIWNNIDWLLLERGYYTFGILTVIVTVYIAVQLILEIKQSSLLGKINMTIITAFAIVAVIFMAVSIRNTEWVLLEKGYYWMGLGFVVITSAMASATIEHVVDNTKHQ